MKKMMAILMLAIAGNAMAGYQCSTDSSGVRRCTDSSGRGTTCSTDAWGVTRCQ